MSTFVTKYAGQYDSDEEISERIIGENAPQPYVTSGNSLERHQVQYEQALREREDIERQIASLCSSGIPNMTHNDHTHQGDSNGLNGSHLDSNRGNANRSLKVLSPFLKQSSSSSPSFSVGPKYAQGSAVSDYNYMSPPLNVNPYYDPQRGAKPSRPQPTKFAGVAPRPPSATGASHAKHASKPPADMPVIKIRGFGRSTPPSGHAIVYQVQFKRGSRHYVPSPRCPPLLSVGEFVVTQCTRGENLGVVTEIMSMQQLQQRRYESKLAGRESEEGEGNLSQIVRVAHRVERQALPAKHNDEQIAKDLAIDLAANKYHLNMTIIDCEYQFDRERLTVYYSCENRVDFRDLVKELCATLMIRIWMKEITKPLSYALNEQAAIALATGDFHES